MRHATAAMVSDGAHPFAVPAALPLPPLCRCHRLHGQPRRLEEEMAATTALMTVIGAALISATPLSPPHGM